MNSTNQYEDGLINLLYSLNKSMIYGLRTGNEVAHSFQKLFLDGHPSRLWTDRVTEFYNKQLKAVLTANNVMLYSTENEECCRAMEQNNEEHNVEVLYSE